MTGPVIGVTLNWSRNDPARQGAYGLWKYSLNQTYADLVGALGCFTAGILPVPSVMNAIPFCSIKHELLYRFPFSLDGDCHRQAALNA